MNASFDCLAQATSTHYELLRHHRDPSNFISMNTSINAAATTTTTVSNNSSPDISALTILLLRFVEESSSAAAAGMNKANNNNNNSDTRVIYCAWPASKGTTLAGTRLIEILQEDDLLSTVQLPKSLYVLHLDQYTEIHTGSTVEYQLHTGPDPNVFDIQVKRHESTATSIVPFGRRVALTFSVKVHPVCGDDGLGPTSSISIPRATPGTHTRYYDFVLGGFIRLGSVSTDGRVPVTGVSADGEVQFVLEHIISGSHEATDAPPRGGPGAALVSGDAGAVSSTGFIPPPRRTPSSITRRLTALDLPDTTTTTTTPKPAPSTPVAPPRKAPYFAHLFTKCVEASVLVSDRGCPNDVDASEVKIEASWSRATPVPSDRTKLVSTPWKSLIRNGIPVSYRETLWATLTGASAVLASRPSFYSSALERTFRVPHLLDDYPTFCPRAVPLFGVDSLRDHIGTLMSVQGEVSLRLVLCVVAEHFPEVTYCPMLPACVALMLMQCREATVAAAIIEMVHQARQNTETHHFRLSRQSYVVQLHAFLLLLKKRSPTLSRFFETKKINACVVAHDMFVSMFSNLLPLYHSLQLFDAFLNEGMKVVFRFAVSLLCMYEREICACQTESEIISTLRERASKAQNNDFASLWRQAYSWGISRKDIAAFEKTVDAATAEHHSIPPYRPSGPVLTCRPRVRKNASNILDSPTVWEDVFVWLPEEKCIGAEVWPIYTTEHNGWSLTTLYARCELAFGKTVEEEHPVLLLMNVIPKSNESSATTTTRPVTIGAYLSHCPSRHRHHNDRFFGNDSSFVFVLGSNHSSTTMQHFKGNTGQKNHNFILCKPDHMFIGCGGSGDNAGSSISVPLDLHIGSTAACETFNAPALLPTEQFHIVQVELFGLGSAVELD
eukprot:PhM_4_TR18718/c0_g1_i1/m.62817/K21841/TBC1D24; TBC1 domain family member 24